MSYDKCECGENISEGFFLENEKHSKCNYHYYFADFIYRVSYKLYKKDNLFSVLSYYVGTENIVNYKYDLIQKVWSPPEKIIKNEFKDKLTIENLDSVVDYLKGIKENIIFI